MATEEDSIDDDVNGKIPPALSATAWRVLEGAEGYDIPDTGVGNEPPTNVRTYGGIVAITEHVSTDLRAPIRHMVRVSGDECAPLVAVLNDALHADSKHKVTWAMVEDYREVARRLYIPLPSSLKDLSTDDVEKKLLVDRLRAHANVLESLLRPAP